MKTRTLLVLALITTVMTLYIVLFGGKGQGTFEREQAGRQIMTLSMDDINHLEINSDKGDFVFDKDAKNNWQIQSPIKYPANDSAISSLLSQLSFSDRRATLRKEDLGDLQKSLTQFGLSTPTTLLKLSTNKGEKYELAIGHNTAVAETVYARITHDGKDSYVVLDQLLVTFVKKDLQAWRSEKVFDFTPDQVQGLLLHQEGKDVEIVRAGTAWKINKPLTAGADEDEMKAFIANLLSLRATKFVTDNQADYTTYGLTSPYLVLNIQLGKEQIALRVGRVDANGEVKFYAQNTIRPAVFEIPEPMVEFIAALLEKVRDRRIMRVGGAESIVSIEYRKGAASSIAFEALPGVDAGWKIAGADGLPADRGEVQTLLTKLENARAANYQLATDDNRATLGLNNPESQIILVTKNNGNAQAEPKVQTLKFSASKKGAVAVESSFRQDLVTVPADILIGLPNDLVGWLSKAVRIYEVPVISAVTWQRGDKSFVVKKDQQGRWNSANPNDGKIDSQVLQHQLQMLSGIPAIKWRPVTEQEFASPQLTLTVSKGGEQRVLQMARANSNEYIARFAGNKYGFIIGVRDFDLLNLSPLAEAKH